MPHGTEAHPNSADVAAEVSGSAAGLRLPLGEAGPSPREQLGEEYGCMGWPLFVFVFDTLAKCRCGRDSVFNQVGP